MDIREQSIGKPIISDDVIFYAPTSPEPMKGFEGVATYRTSPELPKEYEGILPEPEELRKLM